MLTLEQVQALDRGEPIFTTLEGRECIIFSRESFERARQQREAEPDPRQTYPAVLDAWDNEGSPADRELYKDFE